MRKLEKIKRKNEPRIIQLRESINADEKSGSAEKASNDYNFLIDEYKEIFVEVWDGFKDELVFENKIRQEIQKLLVELGNLKHGELRNNKLILALLTKLEEIMKNFDEGLGVFINESRDLRNLEKFKRHFGTTSLLNRDTIILNIQALVEKAGHVEETLNQLLSRLESIIVQIQEKNLTHKDFNNQRKMQNLVQKHIQQSPPISDEQFEQAVDELLKGIITTLQNELQEVIEMNNYTIILIFIDFSSQEKDLTEYITEFYHRGFPAKKLKLLEDKIHKLAKYEDRKDNDIYVLLRYMERRVRWGTGGPFAKLFRNFK